MTHRILVALSVAALTALAGAAHADAAEPPAPFATIDDVCDPSEGEIAVTGPALGADHPHVVVRYSAQGGPITVDEHPLSTDDAVWDAGAPLSAGDEPTVVVDCSAADGPVTYSVELRDRSTTPTTFSGRGGGPEGSVLAATLPSAAHYVADVTVATGRIAIGSDTPTEVGNEGAVVPLGALAAGHLELPVRPVAGTAPQWSVTLRALPVTVTALTLDRRTLSTTSGPLRIAFELDGDARVSVTARAPGATRARSIDVTDRGRGPHALSWDPTATPAAPDGTWTIEVAARDATGTTATASATVAVDLTGPRISTLTGNLITPVDGVRIAVRDADTGTTFTSPVGDLAVTLRDGTTHVVHGPAGRWPLGPNTVRASATDAAGNRTEADIAFTVAPTLGTPCGPVAARTAIVTSPGVVRALQRTRAARGIPLSSAYRVERVLCRDLDGDEVPDMAVVLRANRDRSRTPTPVALFLGTRRGVWRAPLLVAGHRARRAGLRGTAVVLRRTARPPVTIRRTAGRWVVRARRR